MMARDYSDDYSAGPPVGPLLMIVAAVVLALVAITVGLPALHALAAFVRVRGVGHAFGQ